jgi:hypothetical protein
MEISTPESRDLDQELYNPAWDDPQYLQDIENLKAQVRPRKSSDTDLEEASRQKEMNTFMHRKERMNNQDEVTKARDGHILSEVEFLRRLKKISSAFAYAGPILMGRRALTYAGEPVETIHASYAKEWDELRTNEYGVGTDLRYKGWRSTLLGLLLKGLIREEDVDRVFGKADGPESSRYRRTLWCSRNKRCAKCEQKECTCNGRFDYLRADGADRF